MTFLYPIWLLGIAGILIPIALHLLNRNEGKTVPFGSVRFLSESVTTKIQKLKLTEILLLILRCLLIIAISLFLAEPQVNRSVTSREKWLVIEPGLQDAPQWQDLIQKAAAEGFVSHYLLRGFPLINERDSTTGTLNYWQLASELGEKDLDSVVVISFNHLKNFRGEAVAKPENLLWLQADVPNERINVSTTIDRHGQAWIQRASITQNHLEFNTEKTNIIQHDTTDFKNADTISLTILSDKAFQQEQQIVLASLQAIQDVTPQYLNISINASEELPPHAGWWFWLSNKLPPDSPNKNSIGYDSCDSPVSQIDLLVPNTCEGDNSPTWRLTQRFTASEALEYHLTAQLAKILLQLPAEKFMELDKRVLPEEFLWRGKPFSEKKEFNNSGRSLVKASFLLILGLLVMERFLSFKRNA